MVFSPPGIFASCLKVNLTTCVRNGDVKGVLAGKLFSRLEPFVSFKVSEMSTKLIRVNNTKKRPRVTSKLPFVLPWIKAVP